MGNYRPKPLDEIGNMHIKSMEADQEIKKGSSKLGAVKTPANDAFSDERAAEPVKVTPEQVAADEIASMVGDFAKSFGSAGSGKAPASITAVQSRPRVPKKKPEAVAEKAGNSKRVPVKKDSKTLIRNSERNNLFDSYMRVMNDEDDSGPEPEEGTKRSLRKKKAEKKSKASAEKAAKAEEAADSVSAQADKAVASVFGDSGKETAVTDDESIAVTYEEVADPFEELDAGNVQGSEPTPKGNPVRRIVFTAVLLVVLMLSVTVGGIKAFLKLNSDAVAFSGYQLYSAQADYAGTAIGKGDLVFVENRQPTQGEAIAYRDSSGEYGFATFEAALNSESMTVSGSNDKIVVFVNEYRGAVIKTAPAVGGILAAVTDYFHLIMAVLFLLIGVLILLIIFSSKSKAESDNGDDPQADEVKEEAEKQEDEASVSDPFEAFASGDLFEEYGEKEESQPYEDNPAAEETVSGEDAGDAASDSGYMYDLSDEDE